MATVEWRKWNILLLIICLLIGWNYRLPWFSFYSPFGWEGGPSVDFRSPYLAAISWLSSQGNPYRLDNVWFVYPPTFLPFFAVFALFEFRFASQLWWVTYLSLFAVAMLALTLTLKGERKYVYLSLAVLLFLTSYPLLFNFQLGQIELLLASLAILSLVCVRMKHPVASALLLSVATLLKGPALMLLVYFVLFRRDFRYLAYFIVSTLVIVGASLLVVPIGLYWYYIVNVAPTLSVALSIDSMQSIVRYVSLAGMSKISPVVSIAGLSVFAIFSSWVSSRKLAIDESTLHADGMFLMNVLVMLLFAPRTYPYSYVWIMLPSALFLSALLMQQVRLEYLALVGFATFLLNSTLAPDFLQSNPSALVALHFQTYEVLFPSELIGNLMLTLSLIPIFIRPAVILRR